MVDEALNQHILAESVRGAQERQESQEAAQPVAAENPPATNIGSISFVSCGTGDQGVEHVSLAEPAEEDEQGAYYYFLSNIPHFLNINSCSCVFVFLFIYFLFANFRE